MMFKLATSALADEFCGDELEKRTCEWYREQDRCGEVTVTCVETCGKCGHMVHSLEVMQLVPENRGSMKQAMRVVIGGDWTGEGSLAAYRMMRPMYVNAHNTWRVMGLDDTVMFTIQRRKWRTDCEKLGFLDCKSVWKIYRGQKRDGRMITYGIQHENSFNFYRSRAEYVSRDVPALATVTNALPTKNNGMSVFEATVKQGEDAALLLLA